MEFYEQLEHVKKYTAAFWQHEIIDRPCVCMTARTGPLSNITPRLSYEACMSGNYDKFLDAAMQRIGNTYYSSEEMPHVEITLGPDQYAAFLGGTIVTSPTDSTTWLKPCVDDWSSFEVNIDKSENGYFQKLKRNLEYAAKKAEGHFMINMLDLHGNIDAMSALRSPQELCCDIMEEPDDVMRVLNEIDATYPEIYNMAYEAGNMKSIGTLGFQPVYCEGKSATLQCDFSCMLGPEQGRKYVFPFIEKEAAMLDHVVYHLDGKGALCHLDTILGLDFIDCIQWVPGAGQPRSMEWMDVLHKIQAAGKAVWIYDWSVEDVKAYHKELEPDKVVYQVRANTPDQADELLEYLVKNT